MAEGTHIKAVHEVPGPAVPARLASRRRPGRVLLLDEDPLLRDSIARTLVRAEHDVVATGDATAAFARLATEQFDLLLVDVRSARGRHPEMLLETGRRRPELTVVVMAAYAQLRAGLEAVRRGAYDCIQKPFEKDELVLLVSRALEHARQQVEVQALRHACGLCEPPRQLVGNSSGMRHVRAQIDRAAAGNGPVLIRGELGTGKSSVAGLIHAASDRSQAPRLTVNCRGRDGLFEAVLFGEEGTEGLLRLGAIELAERGIVVLEDVDQAEQAALTGLLRAVRDQAFKRRGSRVLRRAEARLIATCGPFAKAGDALAATTIILPPLRERREDIPELVRHFLHRIAQRSGEPFRHVEVEAVRHLQKYAWPGNVRELLGVVERAVLLEVDEGILRATTMLGVLGESQGLVPRTPAGGDPLDRLPLAEVEKRVILDTLAKFEGHRAKTATALGIGIRTLGIKLKKWREEGQLAELPYA